MTHLAESMNDLDIKKIQARDEGALRKFFDAVYPMIQRRVFYYIKSSDEAEELTQDILMSIFRSLSEIRGDKGIYLWRWCEAIARNVIFDYLRRKSLRGIDLREMDLFLESDVDEETRRMHLLQEVMQKLEEKERHILELRLEGMTYKEIAESLGITERALRRRYGRAIQKLRKIIEQIEQEQIKPEESTL